MRKILLLFISAIALGQNVTKSIRLLPDTGQTTSYTATVGEDNDYSINVPSFTDNGNGTITDMVTGLMWQQVDGGEMTIENASTYCNSLTLGGYTDWRLPTPMESFSILNLQRNNPALNTTYFPSSGADYWWTNTFQMNDNTKVWCTNAGGGIGNKPKLETISAGGNKSYHVRAVRDSTVPTTLANHYTDNGDGTVTDNLTQLVWQKVPTTTALTWEQALSYAEGLTLAGVSDWRLPNIKELQSLNDEGAMNPSVNTTYFSAIGVKNYWSSTTLLPNPSNLTSAWYWNTQFGITTYDTKTNTNYVICVRGIPTSLSYHEVVKEANSMQVFPNPFRSKIHISNSKGTEVYELYNEVGTLIYVGNSPDKQDFSTLQNGIYFLKVTGTSTFFKLVKQ